jgi:hypothetical protein
MLEDKKIDNAEMEKLIKADVTRAIQLDRNNDRY